MDNEIELIKVRAERDEAIKAWKVSCDDVKRLMAESERRASALRGMLAGSISLASVKKALEPVYEPLLSAEKLRAWWGILPSAGREIGARYLEAYADREGDSPAAYRARECAKAERAIGS